MAAFDRRLLRHARATRGYLAATAALGTAEAALIVAQAYLLAHAIAAVYLDGAGAAALMSTVAGLAAVVAARAAVAWGREATAVRSAAAVKQQLRGALLARIVALGRDRAATGELVTIATRGLDALDAYFARYLPQLVLVAVVPALVLAVVLPVDPLSAVIIVVTLPLVPVFMVLVGRHTEAANQRQFRALAQLGHHFLDVVRGLPTLRTYGRAAAQVATVGEVSAQQHRRTMRTLRIAFLSSLVLELIATFSVALVAVGIGLRLVGGGLPFATALLILLLAPEAYQPLRALGTHYHASAEGLAAAGDVFAVLDGPSPPARPSAPAGASARTSPGGPARTSPGGPARTSPGGPAPWSARGTPPRLRLDGVTVRHPDRGPATPDRLSAHLPAGAITVLTGASGAGKSTLLDVLRGDRAPDAGRVLVNGLDLSANDPEQWRRSVAWLPQRPWLGAGSIADAIRVADPDADDAAVRAAAGEAGVLSFADALPGGLDTPLGDGGVGLSAGQRQRVALARLFLHPAPLLLLDEPTANVDRGTTAALIAAIGRLARGRTVVIAAHDAALRALAAHAIHLPAPPIHLPVQSGPLPPAALPLTPQVDPAVVPAAAAPAPDDAAAPHDAAGPARDSTAVSA